MLIVLIAVAFIWRNVWYHNARPVDPSSNGTTPISTDFMLCFLRASILLCAFFHHLLLRTVILLLKGPNRHLI